MTSTASPPAEANGEAPLNADDLADIQGLIIRGYNMPSVRHFVLTIGDVPAALNFIAMLVCKDPLEGQLKVTNAAAWPNGEKPDYALNIGFSSAGIEALRLPKTISFGSNPGNFSPFLNGAVLQAKKVHDIGASDPCRWVDKLSTAQAADAHVLLSLYTQSPDSRDQHSATLHSMFAPMLPISGCGAQVYELDVDAINETLADGRVQHKIHFGYTDGISNPTIKVQGQPPLGQHQLPYVDPWQFVIREFEGAEYTPPQPCEFGLNGSFSAFRILKQDVAAFEAFLAAEGRSPQEQEYLAGKLCGRWRNGNPVVAAPEEMGEVLDDAALTDFDYGVDNVGDPCPYSAHTRRANPRGGPHVAGVTNKVSSRIQRRANPYGPPWTGSADKQERGLAGHFICASLTNQFEFIMKSWVNAENFSPHNAGLDPLLAHIEGTGKTKFPYYKNGAEVQVPGLSQFVTTRGGLYCFLPSLKSLAWIVGHGNDPDPWKIDTI